MDLKKMAAAEAVSLIQDGQSIGLGAGSTMAYMAEFLKEKITNGLHIDLYTSSETTREIILQCGMKCLETREAAALDIYFDGCDQFDKDLNALKSGGGIHTIEKLLASMSREFILVGDETKWVQAFDEKIPLVLECIPEAQGYVMAESIRQFKNIHIQIRNMENSNYPKLTSNGNLLLEIRYPKWPPLAGINPFFQKLPGVLETSLFFGMACRAIIGTSTGPKILGRPNP